MANLLIFQSFERKSQEDLHADTRSLVSSWMGNLRDAQPAKHRIEIAFHWIRSL
ncbi:MAG TPA: hypothetical protein VEV17_03525 [Bryobacteraceae bacterium]|nr:hypothetical protein [Bryobacteraceae bacterium]